MFDVPEKLPLPRMVNLLTDRKEERDVGPYNTWVANPRLKIVAEFEASLKKDTPIKLGTPDQYSPPQLAYCSLLPQHSIGGRFGFESNKA